MPGAAPGVLPEARLDGGSGTAVIEVRQLTKRFGAVTAVDRLSFQVKAGTVTGFLGPNGSGKTSTLRMLVGLVRPDSGQARIWGNRYADLGVWRRKVGVVLEASGFHPGRTVLVSSHLLAEVAQTAGQVIVIDHGRLIWSGPVSQLTTATGQAVVVRAPRAAELRAALQDQRAAVRELADGRLEITGAAVEQVATLAAARGLPIFEITEETGSLEEAFLTLTGGERRPG